MRLELGGAYSDELPARGETNKNELARGREEQG
jgi:hypothetical protein